jgi:transposase-like protein
VLRRRRFESPSFAGFRFPPDVILLAVRWYLRYGLSYRDVEELLAERGIEVDHVTIYRWVQRFTPLVIEAARPCRHSVGDRWFVDETYVRVAGVWRYVYRAVDQYGQVIDVYVSRRRNIAAASTFFETMLAGRDRPREVTTDLAAPLLRVVDDLPPRRAPRHDAVCEQSDRMGPRTTQGTAPSDAGATDGSDSVDGDPRTCVHPEPATRPLRTRRRRPPRTSTGRGRV